MASCSVNVTNYAKTMMKVSQIILLRTLYHCITDKNMAVEKYIIPKSISYLTHYISTSYNSGCTLWRFNTNKISFKNQNTKSSSQTGVSLIYYGHIFISISQKSWPPFDAQPYSSPTKGNTLTNGKICDCQMTVNFQLYRSDRHWRSQNVCLMYETDKKTIYIYIR